MKSDFEVLQGSLGMVEKEVLCLQAQIFRRDNLWGMICWIKKSNDF